jgi:RNA polymerase sigma-70 factor (ECF subfamily)
MSGDQTTRLNLWITRLRDGDDSALDAILSFFQNRLARLTHEMLKGYPIVRRMEQTSDVLQNSMLRLSRALRDFAGRLTTTEGAESFHTRDFFRLAALQIRRELLDLAKHYRSRPGLVHATGSDPPAGSTWDTDRLEKWTEFHEQAAALPEKAREVFDLLWYQGMKQAEAAELLGVDVRTVKARWLDARLRLNAVLQGRVPRS